VDTEQARMNVVFFTIDFLVYERGEEFSARTEVVRVKNVPATPLL
jgi:hypothetical protein